MTSLIEWTKGNPINYGFYLTIREGKDKKRFIATDYFIPTDTFRIPMGENGWLTQPGDESKIIAWCYIKNIKI